MTKNKEKRLLEYILLTIGPHYLCSSLVEQIQTIVNHRADDITHCQFEKKYAQSKRMKKILNKELKEYKFHLKAAKQTLTLLKKTNKTLKKVKW